eukprot:Rmarinus@m.196
MPKKQSAFATARSRCGRKPERGALGSSSIATSSCSSSSSSSCPPWPSRWTTRLSSKAHSPPTCYTFATCSSPQPSRLRWFSRCSSAEAYRILETTGTDWTSSS